MKIWIAWQQCMKIQITDLLFLPSLTCPIDRAPSHPFPRTPRLAHETFKIPNSAHSFPPYFCQWFLWMVWLYRPDLEHSRAIHHNRNTGQLVHRRTILLVIYSSHFKFGKKNPTQWSQQNFHKLQLLSRGMYQSKFVVISWPMMELQLN